MLPILIAHVKSWQLHYKCGLSECDMLHFLIAKTEIKHQNLEQIIIMRPYHRAFGNNYANFSGQKEQFDYSGGLNFTPNLNLSTTVSSFFFNL